MLLDELLDRLLKRRYKTKRISLDYNTWENTKKVLIKIVRKSRLRGVGKTLQTIKIKYVLLKVLVLWFKSCWD